MKNDRKPKRRYGVMYFHGVRSTGAIFKAKDIDTWGSTNELRNAYRNAAGHVAASDIVDEEYRQAVVYDRLHGRITRSYTRDAQGIRIKDFDTHGRPTS